MTSAIRAGYSAIVAALFVFIAACSGVDNPQPTMVSATASPTTTSTATLESSAIQRLPVFSVETIDGKTVHLEDLIGTAPLYVLFTPGVDDVLDRDQVSKLQAKYDRFEELGARIVLVVSDLPTDVLRLRDELGLRFPLIADPLGVVATNWQVFDLFGTGGGGPASFVFDAHGTLIASLVASEPGDRPAADEVLHVIEESLRAGAA
ncbi:MAG: redoxin domain-containing protein [Chloroflexi bacterium]|nr:redoxin domain-containing protein [Chloroflexota bacterium]